MKYKRVLLKLSGEALVGRQKFGIEPEKLAHYVLEIKKVLEKNVQLAIVIGGGNIFRGMQAKQVGIDQVQGDYMGMLATLMNGLAIQSVLELHGIHTRLMSSIKVEQVCEVFIRRRAIRHLEKGRVVIFGAGTGNPYFTTDTAAILRAAEIGADIILKGTQVDGVYDKDPKKDPLAKRFSSIPFEDVLHKKLHIMDQTAFTLSRENKLSIIVFDMNESGNLSKIIAGDQTVGTLIA